MPDPNEVCRVCGEPRSAHVATVKGAFTHPREARGEGHYRMKNSGWFSGALGRLGDPDEYWETYEFVPNVSTSVGAERPSNEKA